MGSPTPRKDSEYVQSKSEKKLVDKTLTLDMVVEEQYAPLQDLLRSRASYYSSYCIAWQAHYIENQGQ